ncbi:MAG: hypothetical protein KDA24_13245 [Deltaproteobacteria bacterium]|nr:hypothetical protein [Deltaproteobacteria bacterium]
MKLSALSAAVLATLLIGCGGSGSSTSKAPPVIVLEQPGGAAQPGGSDASPADYAGVAWEQAGVRAEAAVASGEPAEVVALLREFEPILNDPPKDAVGENAWDDLLSALVAMDARYLYARILTSEPMSVANDKVREMRFWLEQGGQMVTIEVKVGSMDAPCEVIPSGTDEAKVVNNCFWLGNAIDLRIPLDSLPKSLDVSKPFWASGFQTCCTDPSRDTPYDELAEAQEVWRVPGLAEEQESSDNEPYVPGKEADNEAPNVP